MKQWTLLENISKADFYDFYENFYNVKSNTSKTEKLKSLIRRQKIKILQKLWGSP